MSFDNRANLAYATIATPPSPALSGTSLTLASGLGSLFPSTNFSITVYPPNKEPLASNAEICYVSSRTGDVLTIVRAQQGTSARSIGVGWQVANAITTKDFTDIESQAIQFISAGTTSASAPTVVFSNANGVSFGANGQTITAAVAAGVGGVAISGGTSSQGTGTVIFSNSNNVSFGLDAGGIMTASIAAGAAAGSISAGTTSVALGQVIFSNSNNVTFGLDGSTLTASFSGGAQSTQPVAASAGNGSFLFSTLGFSNANNVTFGTSAGSIITASINPGAQSTQPVAASASNGSFAFSTLAFSNANNVTFGTSAGSIITASVATAAAGNSVNFSAGTTSNNLGSIVFSNSNGVTFGLNGSTVTASHNGLTAQTVQPVAASASNGSFAFSTLAFSNANNVTFGTSAGSIITASVATAAAGNSVNFSAGTASANLGSIVFSNSNGVSFGLNGSTITASAGGGGATMSSLQYPAGFYTTLTGPVHGFASVIFFQVPQNLSFTRIDTPLNVNLQTVNNVSSAAVNFSVTGVILTKNGNTLNSIASTTLSTFISWTSNQGTDFIGVNVLSMGISSSLSPGPYWLAFNLSTAATGGVLTGAATTLLTNSLWVWGPGTVIYGADTARELGQSTFSSYGFIEGQGVYTSVGNMTQIAVSNMTCNGTGNQKANLVLRFKG